MAGDLSRDANLRFKGKAYTEQFLLDTAGAQTVYTGCPLYINADGDTTHALIFVDSVNISADGISLGIAAEHVEVAASAAETTPISVYVWPTIIGLENSVSAFTNADIGKSIYMSGSALPSETAGDNVLMGKLFTVEDGYAYIQLSTPVVCTGAGG